MYMENSVSIGAAIV